LFLPVGFMGGAAGRFMSSFGLTASFVIAVSLLIAFTLTPMLSARLMGNREWGIGSGESGIGNRESGVGSQDIDAVSHSPFPTPHSPPPIPPSPFSTLIALIRGCSNGQWRIAVSSAP